MNHTPVIGLSIVVGAASSAGHAQTAAPTQPSAPVREVTKGDDAAAKPADGFALADPLTVFASTTPDVVTDSLKFAEGPLWHNGKLFVCDLAGDALYTIEPREDDPATPVKEAWGSPIEFRKPSGRAAGLAVDDQGRLLLAAFTGVVTRTEKDGTVLVIANNTQVDDVARPLARCNDLAVSGDRIFFTDFGKRDSESKGLFLAHSSGGAKLMDADFGAANGVAVSPDGETLYVNDYGKNVVIKFDIVGYPGGEPFNRRVFVDLSADKSPGRCDGLKVHSSGRVFTTGPGGVWVIAADGTPITRLEIEGGASNLCFGGRTGNSVFITTGSRVLSVELATVLAPTSPGSETK